MTNKFHHLCRAAAFGVAALLFVACQGDRFKITGSITNAKDSILYFENMALDGAHVLDSVKLTEEGTFNFSDKAPDAPEFYRLRIAGQIINLSIDSTETVTVKAKYPAMTTQYEVSGSENCQKIRELSFMQYRLQAMAQAISNDPSLGAKAVEDSIMNVVKAYKHDVAYNYIYQEPMKAYAYFALFQYITIGNSYLMLFDPQAFPEDVKVFAAVATNWDFKYPESLRTKNLHNIALEGIRDKRIVERQKKGLMIDASKVEEVSLIDIALNDNHGNLRKLSDLKGKVVLLDFHQFGTEHSSERIMMLRELYNKYHSRGLEIYQVAVGNDEHYWKTQTAALPWICVRDPNGQASNAYLAPAPAIPCDYLIDRTNSIVRGAREIGNLDKEVAAII